MRKGYAYGLVLGWLVLSNSVCAETLRYAVSDESWPPYWVVDEGRISGVFSEVMTELERRLDVELQVARPVPPLRAQKQFADGQVQLECCVSQAWRTAPEQQAVTLWSEPLLEAQALLVFPRGKAFAYADLRDLRGKTIATVRGYGYAGSQYFRRLDGPDGLALLEQVAKGRSHAGIIDRLELAYLRHRHAELGWLLSDIEEGPLVSRSALRVRLHVSRQAWLPALNAAILGMRRDGALQDILARYAAPLP